MWSITIFLLENCDMGFGLWYPNDSLSFRYKISPMGVLNILMGIVGQGCVATTLGGGTLIITGIVQIITVYRQETGDGGRAQRKNAKATNPVTWESRYNNFREFCKDLPQYNPCAFYTRIYNEDKVSSYFWISVFFGINLLAFFYTLHFWMEIVEGQHQQLIDGTLQIDCNTIICHMNRKVLRYGPLSDWAPWAKACGMCLNVDCSLLLLPVIRILLRNINNAGISFSEKARDSGLFAKFFAHPVSRYLPLQKNIEFHKICGVTIGMFSLGHAFCHYANLITADAATLAVFRVWRWEGSNWLTGAIVYIAMFIIFSAAQDAIRYVDYEIFFYSHHAFVVFYLFMFLHGPVFFYWVALPVCLYVLERYLQSYRGNKGYVIVKVEWIPPVMAVYFRPVNKEDFVFKEGQYLYLNCPYVSKTEWHPFTISSAHQDLHNGPRIHLETGQEVIEVPRPPGYPEGSRWHKYCFMHQDHRALQPHEYIDKGDTGYNDYVSCHIKVHGLTDPVPKTWTRRFLEYICLLQGQAGVTNNTKFPFYFYRRDPRGDVLMGAQYGPDGQQIIRVDGPHAAPSEHYTSYDTVMLVGAGIGLTPCASILSALVRYRWRNNNNPEILHFYWIVRHNEIDSFQWLVHMLTELSFELKTCRENAQIDKMFYLEINIYVTAAEKKPVEVSPLHRASRRLEAHAGEAGGVGVPSFSSDQLYGQLLNPFVDSKGQIDKMRAGGASAPNRLQDIWIWNGRPHWDDIFAEMKANRQHPDIGVCFCGAPVIGQDLVKMCEKYSDAKDNILFSLHKENF